MGQIILEKSNISSRSQFQFILNSKRILKLTDLFNLAHKTKADQRTLISP